MNAPTLSVRLRPAAPEFHPAEQNAAISRLFLFRSWTTPSPSSFQALRKTYGTVEAVRGIDFEVRTGDVFGLLGPNGAGKTTTIEILEGIRPCTAGTVQVLGFEPDKQKTALKDRIGLCLQATNLPDKIRVVETDERGTD